MTVPFVIAVACVVTVMFLGITGGSATTATEERDSVSFDNVCAVLDQQETRLQQFPFHRVWNELRACLRTLRAQINSSMPANFPRESIQKVEQLRNDIIQICEVRSS